MKFPVLFRLLSALLWIALADSIKAADAKFPVLLKK